MLQQMTDLFFANLFMLLFSVTTVQYPNDLYAFNDMKQYLFITRVCELNDNRQCPFMEDSCSTVLDLHSHECYYVAVDKLFLFAGYRALVPYVFFRLFYKTVCICLVNMFWYGAKLYANVVMLCKKIIKQNK